MHVFCDFDGTISVEDVTDAILIRFADPAWEDIEAEWKDGRLGSGECMRRQIALVRASREDLDQALGQIEIDPGFKAFYDFCQGSGIGISVVSDGVDYFIRRVLTRAGIEDIPVFANRLSIERDGYKLSSPFSAGDDCASGSGTCKCRLVDTHTGPRIFVGDGRSDFCVASRPEMVFAKDSLATYCTARNIPFVPYETFHDVTAALKSRLNAKPRASAIA